MEKDKVSKQISYLLRHNNEPLDIDSRGFVLISDLIKFLDISYETLKEICETDDKNRYEIIDNKIRARQGHSNTKITEMEFKLIKNDKYLYHGTKKKNLDSILKNGLIPMERQYVHLTDSLKTAEQTADRRKGESVILLIDTEKMSNSIWISTNNVYLTEYVKPEAIKVFKNV